MSIIKFENVKVTTMTAIIELETDIIINSAFYLLPITKLNLKNVSRSTKKFKIPWPGKKQAGCIFSAKYSGITRGIIKTSTKKSFRNSVSIDICTSVKNVSAKLVKNRIHMCGPNSRELAIEAGQHIVNHLINIQSELNYISNHTKERDEVIRWLLKETKGEPFIINEMNQEIVELEEGEIIRNLIIHDKENNIKYIYNENPFTWENGDYINDDGIFVDRYGQAYYRSLTKKEKKEGMTGFPVLKLGDNIKINVVDHQEYQDNNETFLVDEKGAKLNKVSRIPFRVIEVTSVKIPDIVIERLKEENKIIFPKHVNSRIAMFLLNYVQDYAYYHILSDFLNNFQYISRVYNYKIDEQKEIPLSLGKLNIAMINYSYSLNMKINRWKLANLIDGHEGFRARYNNTTDHHVTVSLEYTPDKEETIIRKGLNVVSFMCYRSGIVTQSGPSPDIMEPIYYKFMSFIMKIKDEIQIKDGEPFVIKYIPIRS